MHKVALTDGRKTRHYMANVCAVLDKALYGKCLCCIIPDIAASALFILLHSLSFIMPRQVLHICH